MILRAIRESLQRRGLYVRHENRTEGLNALADIQKLGPPPAGSVALDVGANRGQTALAIRRRFPALPIHAFEPVAASYEVARNQTATVAGIAMVHAAVSRTAGTLKFFSSGTSELASINDREAGHGKVANTVRRITLDGYCSARGLDRVFLLKTDTEGHDLEVLEGASGLLGQGCVSYVLSEVGFSAADKSHTYFSEICSFLETRHFVLVGIYDVAGLWHLRDWGYTFGNVLFAKKSLLTEERIARASA